jgi:hypothetical protein
MNRTLALLVAGCLASSSAFAAKDPCKDVSVKKDAFGTARTYDKGDIDFKKIGESMQLVVEFTGGGGYGGFSAASALQVAAGTAVEVLMADGSVVTFVTTAPTGPVTYTIMGIMVTKYPLIVGVTPEQVGLLLAQDIKAARVMKGAETWMSLEIKPNDAAKWRETVSCMSST